MASSNGQEATTKAKANTRSFAQALRMTSCGKCELRLRREFRASRQKPCPVIEFQSFVFFSRPGRSRPITFCAKLPCAWFAIEQRRASIAAKQSDWRSIVLRIYATRARALVRRRSTRTRADRSGRLQQWKDGEELRRFNQSVRMFIWRMALK